ncbi:MAG: aminomethyl-transferring glycine dehydrogenase [Propionibacteriaceae bacterium]|nr:aminomethyl-transferring glycine dehydrogenase [Propionibacteriaceae bacterium]
MLAALGYASLDELTSAAIPADLLAGSSLDLPEPVDEAVALAHLQELAAMNNPGRAMIGLGYYGTITPAVIRRDILTNPSWYTAYTPYQPEISQGRLEALLVFQTMIADLTDLPCAGASLLDEATAVAEAVAMALRFHRGKRQRVLVSNDLFDASLAVLHTRVPRLGADLLVVDMSALSDADLVDAAAVVVQTPTRDGRLQPTDELAGLADRAHAAGAIVIAAAGLLALALVTPPGQWGADIAVGTTQRFGVPLFFGGPHAAYLSCTDALVRQMPGRLVGVSVDADGRPALRLALQTREQHIRRDKATSNICTAQVLVAIVAAFYAVYHGPEGLVAIARSIHEQARALAGDLTAGGFTLAHDTFFDTLWVDAGDQADRIWRQAHECGLQLRRGDGFVGVSIGEDATPDDLAKVRTAFGIGHGSSPCGSLGASERTDDYMTHAVFHSHRSETQMMRYIKSLADKDYALDRGMIPLGSCTMKLTPAVAAEAILLPGFANVHPMVPAGDSTGYTQLMNELQDWLEEITGYEAVSFQPNAGSQGELAGLLAIRGYHEARGEEGRDICLIPTSAHGTNAASAAMAGLRVVEVAVAPDGSIDIADLAAKLNQLGPQVAVVMVTYPSTHGVFEATMTRVAELAHEAGAQVYVDGANLNALTGLAKPGQFGADVGHLNLHKTFAMPHGGGGPGVGPVAARAHLAPYLPTGTHDQVAGAAFGSAGLLPISHAYIALMGADGLRHASQVAILNANYLAHRLAGAFPVLYVGNGGLVAHECLLDLRDITTATHVTAEDVAKRLIDYGFHAPTMSFPVPGTLMVEPTESEDKAELDRFADAMLAIKAEIDAVEGPDNPLANAPHPLSRVTADQWTHPYSRSEAAYPQGTSSDGKYWAPVARVDNAYGDRNLILRLRAG